MAHLVDTQCVCGTWAVHVLGVKNGVAAGRCAKCSVIRTISRPSDYETIYTEGEEYHAGRCQEMYGYETYHERFGHDYRVAEELRIPKYLDQLRSLDVGCANGAFVDAMRMKGFAAEGLEVNPSMARWAADITECSIHTSWETIVPGFDIITYHDVFEHVVDPYKELAIIREYLRVEGLLIIDVPDADEVFGEHARAPHHQKPEQHMWYWTEHTLRRELARFGFVVKHVDRPIVGKLVVYARKN